LRGLTLMQRRAEIGFLLAAAAAIFVPLFF
jgi:hypothetical protein